MAPLSREPRWALVLLGALPFVLLFSLPLVVSACNNAAAPAARADGGAGTAGQMSGVAGTMMQAPDAAAPDGQPSPAGDPGRVAMHRLDKVEYDHTAKDLLGVATTPAPRFEDDEPTDGFDSLAETLAHMTPARYQQYFDAAKTLADAVWADPALRARIVTCAPNGGTQCTRDIIAAFGLRAWRRPLTDDEIAALAAGADVAMAQTSDFQLSMKRVVTVMLSSLPFIYKIEADPEPASVTPHPLTGYELASRLSYFLWSTMPDDVLLGLGDTLRQDDVLAAQIERMMVDRRFDTFVDTFAGQWLGIYELAAHEAAPSAYPEWDETLHQSMATEMYLYFADLLDNPFDGFLTADLHFVDGRLAQSYRLSSLPSDAPFVRSTAPAGRLGFLGLAGFLTLTSTPTRTSPATRGSFILEHLLCDGPPPHPGAVPQLDAGGVVVVNTRKALEQSFAAPSCLACHDTFDGVGFGLEHFDGIGQFRSNYSPTEPIFADGTLTNGTSFDGATALAAALAKDPRLPACAVHRTLGYALGRVLDAGDQARVASLATSWQAGTFRDLIRKIVLSDAFRFRHGETP